jgi:hypothetical protein
LIRLLTNAGAGAGAGADSSDGAGEGAGPGTDPGARATLSPFYTSFRLIPFCSYSNN